MEIILTTKAITFKEPTSTRVFLGENLSGITVSPGKINDQFWTNIVLLGLGGTEVHKFDLRQPITGYPHWRNDPDGIQLAIDTISDILGVANCCSGGGGGGTVDSVVAGAGITVDSTDPANPIVAQTATGITPGSYTNTNLTVGADGRLTAAANGSAGGVTSVGGTAPIQSSGGATPNISVLNSTGGFGATDAGKVVKFGAEGNAAFSGATGIGLQSVSSGNGIALNVESGSLISPAAEFINTGGQIAHFHNITAQGMEVENDGGLTWTSGTGATTTRTNLGISEDRVYRDINQVAHGLSVGNIIRFDGTDFILAKADIEANAECMGIVSAVADVDNFTMTTHGYVTGLSGLTSGVTYFLSEITAGLLTATPPTATGNVRKAQFIATSTTTGHYNNFVGYIIP